MPKSRFLPIVRLLILLCGALPAVQAAAQAIKLTSIAEIEVVKDGVIRRSPPEKAVPGTEIIFTNTFENVGSKSAGDIVIDNPIPANTEYKAGSAFGKDCAIVFSADGAKTFATPRQLKVRDADGKETAALPSRYTHIRWSCSPLLAAGKLGEVGFRATIK